jgi:GNAT superfamily N-acetyltransferase
MTRSRLPTSSSPSPTPQAIAQDAFVLLPLGPQTEELSTDRFIARHTASPHPLAGPVGRIRLHDVEADREEILAWFAAQDRDQFAWLVGPDTAPASLATQLLAHGAVPYELEPVWAAMILTSPPPAVDAIDVRKVASLDELHEGLDVIATTGGFSDAEREAAHAIAAKTWPSPHRTSFVAYVDGVPVGSGGCGYAGTCTYLSGSGVLAEFRGRGVYRALVRARWDDAVARGQPALVIQAGRMSKPILERLGFETVCEVQAFIDHVPNR